MPVTPAPTMSTSTSGAPTSVVPVFVPIGITYSMDLSLTEAERDLVAPCRAFAQTRMPPRPPAAWEGAPCPPTLLPGRGELGLPGMLGPGGWGAPGMSPGGSVATPEGR